MEMKRDKRETGSKEKEVYEFSGVMSATENVLFMPRVTVRESDGFGRATDADLFINGKYRENAPQPAIVFLHGGAWRYGSPSQFYYHSAFLAEKHNFVALNVDYRMSGEELFPAALDDAVCAVEWLRAHRREYNIDPGRIALCGGSAGAHIAALASASCDVNGAVLFNGLFDMWDLAGKDSLAEAMSAFFGGTAEEVPERYDEVSPIRNTVESACPTLLLHGSEDTCVSHEQSVAYCNKLRDSNIHAEIEIYEGKDHGWFNRDPDRQITMERMERFLCGIFKLSP